MSVKVLMSLASYSYSYSYYRYREGLFQCPRGGTHYGQERSYPHILPDIQGFSLHTSQNVFRVEKGLIYTAYTTPRATPLLPHPGR